MESINLQCYQLQNKIMELIQNSNLPIYICFLVIKDILNEISELNQLQLQIESLEKFKQENPEETTIEVPLDIKKEENNNE